MKSASQLLVIVCLFSTICQVQSGVAYPDPPGGWTYIFNGDVDTAGEPGSGFTSLDGAWSHDNGSDEWDGSKIGGTFGDGNRPGGVMTVTEGGVVYLRIQDTGDPRDYGFADPGSNRKAYFGHNMNDRGATDTVLDDGVTLTFRARLPTPSTTTAPLDPLYRDGQQAGGVRPFPPGGDGYVTSDQGKGNFVIRQGSGGAIAFSLTQTNDTSGGALTPTANFGGLTMNEFAGNQIADNVNFGQGTKTNLVPFDPTQWHEIWIVLRKDAANIGTHEALIYVDGSLTPTIFKMTAGTGSDYSGFSYLAIGMTATPQNAALDIDFVAYQITAVLPQGAQDNLPPEISDLSPAPGTLFYQASQGLSFTAKTQSTNSLPPANIKLTLNGVDVSSSLNVSGTAQSRTVTFSSLSPNTLFQADLIVSD